MRQKAQRRSFVGESALALLVLFAAPGARAQEPIGSEFQVNSYTTGPQGRVSVARRPDGTFLVAWVSVGQDGDSGGVWGRVYNADGTPQTDQFQVSAYTTNNQDVPSAGVLGNGDFVVVWDSAGQDGSGKGVFGRLVSAGAPAGAEFPVNAFTAADQSDARVAGSDNGFVVVWNSANQDGDSEGVFGRCFTLGGSPLGGDFAVNSSTAGSQFGPDVAMNASGAFVVAWTNGPTWSSQARLYASGCTPAGAEFAAHPGVTPAVGMDASGQFVVAATTFGADGPGGLDGSTYGIQLRRFDATAAPEGPLKLVNNYTTGVQEMARASMSANGNFVLTWDTFDGTTLGASRISARAFQAHGAPAGQELLVDTYTTFLWRKPAVASDQDGNFVVVWQGSDGDAQGVKAQLFSATDLIFADGFDSGNWDAWSGASSGTGNLAVSADCGLTPTSFGLKATITDTTSLYAFDNSPNDEKRYRARFYFDPRDFDPGVSDGHLRTRIFIGFEEAPNRRLFAIVLKKDALGQYSLLGRVRQDDGSQADTGFFDITDAAHYVEIDWQSSSGPDALDGSFQMWIDGTSKVNLTALDNSISSVDFARLGALSVKTGAGGSMCFDQFESRRHNPIGEFGN